jgi:Protein of unknown function (DUF429)
MKILGVDFTSAPKPRKTITLATGVLSGSRLRIETLERIASFAEFESVLKRPGPWIGGFDFPFGLPREAVRALRWPQDWSALVRRCEKMGRKQFKLESDALRESRPRGRKYPKRAGDDIAQSHSPMKCVHPPVGWMFVEGAPRLLRAGVTVVPMLKGDPERIAVEAYPGYTARALIGRHSYKHDNPAKQTEAQRRARRRLLSSLGAVGNPTGIALSAGGSELQRMVSDGTGDLLDSAICAMQACWSWQRRKAAFGLPSNADLIEGWIATVPARRWTSESEPGAMPGDA